MRQCEYKRSYDPEYGRYVKKHIYGEQLASNVLKSISKKIFGKNNEGCCKNRNKETC